MHDIPKSAHKDFDFLRRTLFLDTILEIIQWLTSENSKNYENFYVDVLILKEYSKAAVILTKKTLSGSLLIGSIFPSLPLLATVNWKEYFNLPAVLLKS